jgi:acetyl/propionyl-CoA carboxylase alpha subunit
MGIETVAVYSDADTNALHVRMADNAVNIGKGPAHSSYLNMENIIAAAKLSGADAIHPGYGFLSENATFAQMSHDNQITFIGYIKILTISQVHLANQYPRWAIKLNANE